MAYWPDIVAIFVAYVIATLSPGVNLLAVAGTSLRLGRAAGLRVALGIATGSLLSVSLAVFGLAAMLAATPVAGGAIGLAGGVYLCWLGVRALRLARLHTIRLIAPNAGERPILSGYIKGLLVQLTNPKAYLFWFAIMSLVMGPEAPLWVGLALISGIAVLSFLLHCGFALVFSASPVQELYAKFGHRIEALQGMVFIGLGAYVLYETMRFG